jgi:nucleotide-binding universal stress UspA family protein
MTSSMNERQRFEKVLVATDLSPATEALVSALPGLREFGTRELALVHVAKPSAGRASESTTREEELLARLNDLADELRNVGFLVTVSVRAGEPLEEVVKEVQATDPDVVLVGSRGHTRIREAFIGSVAWDIVRRVGRPVLLQRIEPDLEDPEAALESRASGLPKHVVYPTDFSDAAKRARPWLQALARDGGPSITLLHVTPTAFKEGMRDAETQLEELAQELREQGATEVSCRVRTGIAPYEEILDAGGDSVDTLVVMSTQGRGFFPGAVLGSVGRQVVRQAAARVLLVPGEEPEARAQRVREAMVALPPHLPPGTL